MRTAPALKRIKGRYRFGFSSLTGFIGELLGALRKQKEIIRNL